MQDSDEKKIPAIEMIYRQMNQTAESAGLKIISDDHCCKLLAWLYAFGGANEAVIFNYKLNVDIKTAQKRLNIDGGEMPNLELLPMLQFYLKQVEPFLAQRTDAEGNVLKFVAPEWVYEICKYYNLSTKQL